jgi:hypothetical protein
MKNTAASTELTRTVRVCSAIYKVERHSIGLVTEGEEVIAAIARAVKTYLLIVMAL